MEHLPFSFLFQYSLSLSSRKPQEEEEERGGKYLFYPLFAIRRNTSTCSTSFQGERCGKRHVKTDVDLVEVSSSYFSFRKKITHEIPKDSRLHCNHKRLQQLRREEEEKREKRERERRRRKRAINWRRKLERERERERETRETRERDERRC